MENKYREGDVVRWSFADQAVKKRELSVNAGTLYWCCSRIAVFNEERNLFYDTYWGIRSSNKNFEPDDPERELKYIGNFDEWDDQGRYAKYEELRKYYKESDIINLSHSNSFGEQLYLKKGAQRNKDIILKNLETIRVEHLRKSKSEKESADRMEDWMEKVKNNEVSLDEIYIW